MDPVIISFGGLTVRWYGVMAAVGFVSAFLIMLINRKYTKLCKDQIANILITAMISGVLGSRIFYVVQNWWYYKNHLGEVIRIDKGGLVFYGGFILALLILIVYIRKYCRADVIRVFDVMSPALALAHAFGRVGCFFNGCCFGKPADLAWSVVYKPGTIPFDRYGDTPLHPVQIYETLLNIILACILFVLVRKSKRGVAMSCYILAYGILRFVDEFFRGDHPQKDMVFDILTPAQAIGCVMIPLGIGLLVYFIFLRRGNDAETFEKTEDQA